MDPKDDLDIDPVYRLLALCARVDSHPLFDEQLGQQLRSFEHWMDLPAQAELHGMAPLLWHHISRSNFSIPSETAQTLKGLYIRERFFTQAHTQTLLELTSILEQAGIQALVLKGLALGYEYYPDPALRPASDIDFLLKPADVLPATGLLETAGFHLADSRLPYLNFPPQTITLRSLAKNGFFTNVEFHHHISGMRRAINFSYDNEFSGFDRPSHAVRIGSGVIHVPHPLDMLDYLVRHLKRHLLASASSTALALKWIADITSIVERHADLIDWKENCALLNRLEMFYALTPFPERLSSLIPLKQVHIPAGINQYPQGWPQRKFWEWRRVGGFKFFRQTFASPSEWWLRIYYGIERRSTFWFGQVVYRVQILILMLVKLMDGLHKKWAGQ